MIAPMKKTTVITLDKERRETLEDLRALGILHLHIEEVRSDEADILTGERDTFERALAVLPAKEDAEKRDARPKKLHDHPIEDAEEILDLAERRRQLAEEHEHLRRDHERMSLWGDFEPKEIPELDDHGVYIRFYECTPEEFDDFDTGAVTFEMYRSKTLVRFVAVYTAADRINEDHLLELPERSLSSIEKEMRGVEGKIETLDKELDGYALSRDGLDTGLELVLEALDFEHAHAGMDADEGIAFVTGFLPEEKLPELKDAAVKNGWGLVADDPDEEDRVPTEVKNPKWISIIRPVFSLLGTVPGYREFDISFFFLVFFSIFFAMIIGDAGYGSILFLGALIGIIKGISSKRGVSQGTALLAVLSLTTIGWGAVTGTWFGSQEIVQRSFLSNLVIDRIGTFDPRSSETVKYICFILGTVQISIAHIWKFGSELRQKPRIRALAQLGWFMAVLGLFYLVLNLVLSGTKYPMPQFALYLLIAGFALIILFSKQEGNFFKGILNGVGGFLTTFLDGIGAFSDIISYIRLFAVGLASVEIAQSFNEMAAGSGNGVVGIIGGAIILIFGHTLNLAMGALSVIVHGVRLNMLEFSGHLGMEWTGVPYTPFSKRNAGQET
jgi:V/A-type H+-transporting ATPase subunit I